MSHAHWHYGSYADYSLEAADGTTVGTGRLPAGRRRRLNQILGQKTGVRRGRRADLERGGEGKVSLGGWGNDWKLPVAANLKQNSCENRAAGVAHPAVAVPEQSVHSAGTSLTCCSPFVLLDCFVAVRLPVGPLPPWLSLRTPKPHLLPLHPPVLRHGHWVPPKRGAAQVRMLQYGRDRRLRRQVRRLPPLPVD